MRDDQKTKAELGSGAGGKKPIKEAEKLRARKAKLERVSSELTKHKNADEELDKARADCEKTFDAISDWIALIDLKGRILRTNRSGEDFTGISSDQIAGQSCCKLVHGSDNHVPGCPLQKMLHSRQRERAELKVPDTNRWLIVIVDPVIDKEGNLIGAVHITCDITERKLAGHAQRESEQKYRALVEQSLQGIIILQGFQIVFANPTAAKIAGLTVEEVLVLTPEDIKAFIPAEEQAAILQRYEERLADKPVQQNYELRLARKNGDGFWLDVFVSRIEYLGKSAIQVAFIDITERKRAEEAYRSLVDHSLQGLAIFQNVRAVFANQAMADITGYTVEEMLTLPPEKVQAFVHPDDRELVWSRHKDRLNGEEPPERYEFSGIRKDGSTCWLELYASRIEYQGKPAIQAAYVDITERKKAEEKLRERQEDLVRAQRIAHLGSWERDFIKNEVSWSEELYRIFGVDPKGFEPTYENFLKLVHPEDRQLVKEISTNATSCRQPFNATYRIIRPDGTERTVQSIGEVHADEMEQVTQIVGTSQDITERKKAEETLRKSEERFRQVAENTQEWIWESDANGLYTYASPLAEKILGYKVEEIVGKKHFYDLFHPEDRERLKKEAFEVFAKKESFREFINRNVHKNGLTIWLSTSGVPVLDDKDNLLGYRGADADITDRKKAEEALRESEEHYRMLAETMNDGLGVIDEKCTYVYVNNKFGEILGYSPDEMVGRYWTDFYDEQAQKIINEQLIERKKGVAKPYELKNTRKDGQKIFLRISPQAIFDENGKFKGSFAVLTDITEQKKAEEQIAKLAKFPAENPNPVLRISGRGTVIYANKASANLLKTWDCRVGKSVTDRWHELVMDSLSSGQSQQTEVKCDGRIFSLTFAPVVKANYVNVYGHDITERKKAEEEIQNLNKYREQMAQAEQLASVGTLSASLAHELTQPLTVVRLSIENSLAELEKTSCPDTVVEDLKEGLSEVSSIASIVNRFRNFARRSSEIKVAEVDLKAVAERIVELLNESAWRAKVTLQVEGMDKLPPIYSHEKDLERLFFSLVENAIQAADGKKSRQVIISGAVRDEHIELQFSDNCGGIAPEHLDRIFEPFFTTKHADERTGLGLCVVERIVSQLGGKVRVESKLGKGSTFFVTLPIKGDER